MIHKSVTLNQQSVARFRIANTSEIIAFPKKDTYMALGKTAYGIMKQGITYDVDENEVPEHIRSIAESTKAEGSVKFPFLIIEYGEDE